MTLTNFFRSPASVQSTALRALACLMLVIELGGCASRPAAAPTATVDASLSDHVTMVAGDGRYLNIEAARIDVPAGSKADGPGSLWISGHHMFVRHATSLSLIAQLDHQTITGNVSVTKIQLHDGTWTDAVNQYFLWCPTGHTPDSGGDQCLRVRLLVGEEGTRQYRPHPTQWQPMGFGGILERQLSVFVGVPADQQRMAFYSWQNQADEEAKQQKAARIEANEQKQRNDQARLERMRSAAAGTKDFCTSRFLLARSKPIDSNVPMNCGMFGEVTIGQLRDGHWDIQVTNRIPTEGQFGTVGDSIEITATKLR